jgi:hypothetical protein
MGEVKAPLIDADPIDPPTTDLFDFDLSSCESFGKDHGFLSGLFGEVEMLLVRYNRADGIRIGSEAGESGHFDWTASPRITAGWVGPRGMGIRGRYWHFDEFEPIGLAGEGLGVDTSNIDLEVYEAFVLSCNWVVELSGGVRYNKFTETMVEAASEDRRISVDGWGMMAAAEARRKLRWGHLYGRGRGVMMLADKRLHNEADGGGVTQDIALNDITAGMAEIAIGYEFDRTLRNGSVLYSRIGAEYQYWWDYSNSFTVSNPIAATDESFWAGPSGVGFGSLVVALGLRY